MKVLRFTLSGEHAFFKQPEVNTYYYFTYGHIHKVALLGMFGAILGYGGYTQQAKDNESLTYPEFYERLKDLHVSIIPLCEKGGFDRKIQIFNNSVGYALEKGILNIRQQWLEQPCWIVCVLLDSPEAEKLANSLQNRCSVYSPYLGSNDHFADIGEVAVIDADVISNPSHVDGLFLKCNVSLDLDDDDLARPFKYEEMLPITLDPELNMYEYERFVMTNMAATQVQGTVYGIHDVSGKEYHIMFY